MNCFVGMQERKPLRNVWAARCWIRSPSCTAARTMMKMTATRKTTSKAWPLTASMGRAKTKSHV